MVAPARSALEDVYYVGATTTIIGGKQANQAVVSKDVISLWFTLLAREIWYG